ncbi:NADPH:quinone oxidoreductase family protein [Novosphingobium sp.]|uniref:NADPH:quinone oxidoreductase family protein n=1 Tax=Novosphingobium sp. TaxID=1874826 RepID=UPI001EB3CCBB|nr:NADPH:quinone oxidoreductase family protein [Novosphingobium sp.]MBK6802532.1 NADPH:quinone oxidoreductase family protein [Novosphingobium sp.]MBK9009266.1 NADPH:quinone oxidoreductase family protein [Novosphingobium sp.]
MKALRTHAIGGPETLSLDEVETPQPGPGQVRIKVKACAVNFPDVLMIQDLYQFKPQRPYSPGGELSGIIDAVGEGVTQWQVGDRVIAMMGNGGMAQEVLAPAEKLFPLPEGVSFETGASLLMTYGTNMHGLLDRGHLKAGDTLLVLGAAGGVGLAAVELGKAYGAKVVAAVSSEEKAAAAREHGADETVIYPRGNLDKDQSKALAEAFKAACGPEGANVIYDIIGGDYSEPALRSIAWEGRFCVVGFTAGIPRMPLNLTLLKSCDVCGVFWGAFAARDPKANAAHIAKLFDLLKEGRIRPRVSATFPLERGGEAIAMLGARAAIGKVVVTMG